MDGFIKFMGSTNGRIVRGVVGGILLLIAFFVNGIGTIPQVILVIVGLLGVGTAALDVCLLAPLFGAPMKGSDIRKKMG